MKALASRALNRRAGGAPALLVALRRPVHRRAPRRLRRRPELRHPAHRGRSRSRRSIARGRSTASTSASSSTPTTSPPTSSPPATRSSARSARSATPGSTCPSPAGTGRSADPTRARRTCAHRNRCSASVLPSLSLPDENRSFGEIRRGYDQGPDDRTLRLVERDIDLGEDGRFIVRVAGPADEIEAAVEEFVWSLTTTFACPRPAPRPDHAPPDPLRPAAARALARLRSAPSARARPSGSPASTRGTSPRSRAS